MAVLGIGDAEAEFLQEQLIEAAAGAKASLGGLDEFGQRYTINFECVRVDRRATVRSCWILLHGERFPRLTTCYVLTERETKS